MEEVDKENAWNGEEEPESKEDRKNEREIETRENRAAGREEEKGEGRRERDRRRGTVTWAVRIDLAVLRACRRLGS